MCGCDGMGVVIHALTPPVVCEGINLFHEFMAQLPAPGVFL